MQPEPAPPNAKLTPAALKAQGLDQFNRGDREEALVTFQKAAEAFVTEGDTAGAAEMYNNVGVIKRLQRDWPAAFEALDKAEAGFEQAGDSMRQGQVAGNLGDLYASMGKREEAARAYSKSSELLAEAGEGDFQGEVLRAFSLMRLKQRRWIEAIDLMSQSIEVRNRPSIFQRIFFYLLQFARKLLGTR